MHTFKALGISRNRRKEILDQYIPINWETNNISDVLQALYRDVTLSEIEKLYIAFKVGDMRKV